MGEIPRSVLLEADWNEEWMRLARTRRRPDVPAAWDARARHFRPRETAPYAREFIRLMGLEPGESVLDMGCGGGIYNQACVHADKMLSGAAAALSRSANDLAALRDNLLGQHNNA